jgi:hypothetical protein
MVHGQYTKAKGCSYARRKAECLDTVTPWSVSPVLVLVSTPSRCHLLSPVYLSLCFLSLCASSSVCQVNQRFCVSAPAFSSLSFLTLLGFDPCLSWLWARLPDHSACPWPRAGLSSCTIWTLTWFMNSRLYPTCLLPPPFAIINIGAQPSASCVCIWVSPCGLIDTALSHGVLTIYNKPKVPYCYYKLVTNVIRAVKINVLSDLWYSVWNTTADSQSAFWTRTTQFIIQHINMNPVYKYAACINSVTKLQCTVGHCRMSNVKNTVYEYSVWIQCMNTVYEYSVKNMKCLYIHGTAVLTVWVLPETWAVC